MKKLTAIILAVVLAFIIALGDQIIALSLSGNPLGLKSFFSQADDGGITITDRPQLPEAPEPEPVKVNLTYDERIEKGNYYFDRGFLTFAANEYVKAANLEPDRIEPYFKLSQTHFDLMDYAKAKRNAEEVLERAPTQYEAKFQLMRIALKQNDFTAAQQYGNELIAAGITDPRVAYYSALVQIAFGQYEAGEKLLRDASNLSVGNTELDGSINTLLGSYEEFAFAQSAEDLYLAELLSRSLNQIGEYELAVYKLKDILRTRSDLRDSWVLLGFAYLNLEKYLFALSSFEQAYDLDPQKPATQYFLGVTYTELQQYDDAIVFLNYALDNGFEQKALLKQKLADLYLEVEDYEKSVQAYEEVLNYNKQDAEAFVRPVWIYLDFLNDPIKAMKLAELAVITFPFEPMAYNLLGWSQTGTRNFVESEKNLMKAITMDPEFAAAYYNLAKLYEEMGRVETAMENYQKAYEFDQNGSIGNLSAKRFNALMIQ